MSDIAIRFSHVSKLYELGVVGTGTLSHDLHRWWVTSVLKREDPYLRIGQTNDRTQKGDSPFVYALKDIDFEVHQGDVLGIIGKNGAGKSTLLKLLSRITYPTAGNIYTKGRIASLLEVGTGFHPELTGRENIYMNGSILGMRKHEIDRKLDEIVDFSGCERYLDTPAKRYSSGMVVRLGFAIAAHLEPEILVVDEVLAVGDAEFQKKAIGKMQDVASGEGRTVLFVSHNMGSIRALCNKCILLENGQVAFNGDTNECISLYLEDEKRTLKRHSSGADLERRYVLPQKITIESVTLHNDPSYMASDEPISLTFTIRKHAPINQMTIEVMVENQYNQRVGSYISPLFDISHCGNLFSVHLTDLHLDLARGFYKLNFNIGQKILSSSKEDMDAVYEAISFKIDYLDHATHKPFNLWNQGWGNINYSTGKITVQP